MLWLLPGRKFFLSKKPWLCRTGSVRVQSQVSLGRIGQRDEEFEDSVMMIVCLLFCLCFFRTCVKWLYVRGKIRPLVVFAEWRPSFGWKILGCSDSALNIFRWLDEMEQDIESDSDDVPMCSCCPFQTSVDAKWTPRWFCEEAPHHGLQTLQNPRAHDRCSFAARSGNCSKKWRSLGNNSRLFDS